MPEPFQFFNFKLKNQKNLSKQSKQAARSLREAPKRLTAVTLEWLWFSFGSPLVFVWRRGTEIRFFGGGTIMAPKTTIVAP